MALPRPNLSPMGIEVHYATLKALDAHLESLLQECHSLMSQLATKLATTQECLQFAEALSREILRTQRQEDSHDAQ